MDSYILKELVKAIISSFLQEQWIKCTFTITYYTWNSKFQTILLQSSLFSIEKSTWVLPKDQNKNATGNSTFSRMITFKTKETCCIKKKRNTEGLIQLQK